MVSGGRAEEAMVGEVAGVVADDAITRGNVRTDDGGDLGVGGAAVQAGGDPSVLYHYAIALRDTGKTAEAIKVLTALAGLKVDFPEKAEAREALDALKKPG